MFWIPSKVRKTFRAQELVTDFLVQKFEKVIMLLFSEVVPGKPKKKNVVMGDHKFVDPLLVFPLLLSLLSRES